MIDPLEPDFESTPASDRRASFGYGPADDREAAQPIVSIVTPFFDTRPDVFAEAVRSVKRQSLQQWEWLIVDDGSTNESSIAVLSRLRDDPRVRVLRHGSNRGVSAARNTAIKQARADFVLFLDSDDLMEPTTAEKWLWFLTSHPEYAFVDGYVVGFGATQILWRRGFQDADAFLDENLVGARCMIRRHVLTEIGGFDESITDGLEDWELWLSCAAAGYWGHTLPEYLAWQRLTGRGAERERWATWDRGEAQQAFRKSLRERYPELWRDGLPRVGPVAAAEVELEALPTGNALAKGQRRLLLVLPWTAMGGADKFNFDLVTQLNRRGWETTIVTTLDGDHSWLPRFAGLTPDVFALSHFLKPEDYPRFIRYIIRSRDPDFILISHSLFAYEALPYLRAIAGRTPIADYCHIVEERWLDGGYPRRSVDRQQFLDLQMTSSDALKEWMVDHGNDRERIDVCYTSIDPLDDERRGSRRELGLPTDVPIIVYPGRLVEQKQPPVFARTMRELRRRRYDFLALAIGEGPYLPWLRDFVRRESLQKHVRCLGTLPNDRVQAIIAASDCVFIPSTHEGISLAFYEAMAAGVVVVGADVGGQRELVTPECGVLIERADEHVETARYTSILSELLAAPERRRAMGEAGRERIRSGFTLDAMGERMTFLLERASTLAEAIPRPVPSAAEARQAALDGVRIVWWTKPAPSTPSWVSGLWWRLRHRLLRVLTVVGTPIYKLGMRFGLHSLERAKDRVYYALFPEQR